LGLVKNFSTVVKAKPNLKFFIFYVRTLIMKNDCILELIIRNGNKTHEIPLPIPDREFLWFC